MKEVFFSKAFLALFVLVCACSDSPNKDQEMTELSQLEGRWTDGHFEILISGENIRTFRDGETVDYPQGSLKLIDSEYGIITLESDETEMFYYKFDKGDLIMAFERGGVINLSRVNE